MKKMNVKTQQQKFKNQYQQTNQQLDGLDGSSHVNFQPHIVKDLTNTGKIISSSFVKGTDLDLKHSLSPNSSTSSSTMLSRNSSSCASNNNNCTATTAMPTIGVNLRVTGQCSQGGRKYMEDFFSVAYQQTENCRDLEYAFIGIYDGHGGAEAATFAKEHLMMEIINQKSFWSDSDQDVLCAIREGYIATHYAMWREQEKWPTTANGLLSTAGSTATIAFIRREKIYIGHVGDSGIVLGYQNENENFWRAKQLTTDHKPESSAERKRIMRSGGKIGVKSGVPRVVWNRPRNAGHRGPTFPNTPVDEIPFLAVARSLGDLWSYNAQLNEFVVSPVPDVQVIRINPKTFRCLIFGTDGLWNVVTPQEAVDTVFKKETNNDRLNSQHQYINNSSMQDGSQWTNPSKALVEQALRAWSGKKMRADNTSVVTVILYPPSNVDNAHADGEHKFATDRTQCQLNYIDVDDNEFSLTLRKQQSFQEIAEKYLPPERFRNFNSLCVNLIDDYHMYYTSDRKVGMKSSQLPWCAEAEVNDNSTDVESALQKPRKVQLNLQDFNELLKPHTPITSQLETTYSSDLYMNSFAETYNSLLDAQIVRSEEVQAHTDRTSTPPPTSIPNNSGLHMQQILQEQQMYQQQCMSGEDGYLLTTLETPREQRRCGEMSTIKLYEHIDNESIQPAVYNQMELGRNAAASLEVKLWSHLHDYNYQAQQQAEESLSSSMKLRRKSSDEVEIMQPVKHRLLELNSVLQQEQAEEQQVAFEYEQLQQRLKQQKVENPAHVAQTSMSVSNIEEIESSNSEEDYLLGYETIATAGLDETVQINEISSSNSMPLFEGADLANANVKTTDRIVTPTVFMERIEKIEILADKPELVIEAPLVMLPKSSTPAAKLSLDSKPQIPQKMRPAATAKLQNKTKSEILLSKAVKSPYFTSQNRNHILNGSSCNKRLRNNNSATTTMHSNLISVPQSQFPNIPNENYRESNAVAAVTGCSSQRCTSNRSNISPNDKEHRQLRSGNLYNSGSSKSNTNVTAITTAAQTGQINNANSSNLVGVDYYSKRTLRTRNSLTKDLKAKLSSSTNNPNNSSVLKRSVAIATQLIRASRAHSNCAENMKKETFITAHVINLRSRQVNGQQLKHVPSSTLNSSSRIAVTARKSRNLRSNPITNSTDDNNSVYSKMTRVQLVGGSTPPAPRLLRAATAVPATRARSTASVQTPPVFRRRSAQRNTTETVTSANSIRTSSNTAIRRGSSIARRVKR